jgi:hypothetical protein
MPTLPSQTMNLVTSRLGAILSLLSLLIVPAFLTGLFIQKAVNDATPKSPITLLGVDSLLLIAFSAVFYVFMVIVPAWASLYTARLPTYWFVMLLFLYLFWSALFFLFDDVGWAYFLLLLTLLSLFSMLRTLFRYVHIGLFALYMFATGWVLYLFILTSVLLFTGKL